MNRRLTDQLRGIRQYDVIFAGPAMLLAAHLGIDKQAMNKILIRANEPGGEKVLAMLVWLEKHAGSKTV